MTRKKKIRGGIGLIGPAIAGSLEKAGAAGVSAGVSGGISLGVIIPNILYSMVINEGVKSVKNFKLFYKTMRAFNIVKEKYKPNYELLNEEQKNDFGYAIRLIHRFYNKKIGQTFSVLSTKRKLNESCSDEESLEKQYRLMIGIRNNSYEKNEFKDVLTKNTKILLTKN